MWHSVFEQQLKMYLSNLNTLVLQYVSSYVCCKYVTMGCSVFFRKQNKTGSPPVILFSALFWSSCFVFIYLLFFYYLHCPFLYKLIKQLFSAEHMIYLARCGNIYMCFLIMAVQVHHVVLQWHTLMVSVQQQKERLYMLISRKIIEESAHVLFLVSWTKTLLE